MPRAYAGGLLMAGDSAGFLNGMRLKGIHLAVKSGMLAAEVAFEAVTAGACDAQTLGLFESMFKESWAYDELRVARNFHQGFKKGLFAGMLNAGLAMYTGGRAFGVVDKLTDVYNSGTLHDEDQVPHLHVADTNICRDRCTVEYGNPCQFFCPAKVYDPLFEKKGGNGEATYEGRLQIDFSNCVHCKTCDIMDPYQIITWVPPQGGEGPVYTGM
jgi:electron-transferring-flavoprotein dehydrogenase